MPLRFCIVLKRGKGTLFFRNEQIIAEIILRFLGVFICFVLFGFIFVFWQDSKSKPRLPLLCQQSRSDEKTVSLFYFVCLFLFNAGQALVKKLV